MSENVRGHMSIGSWGTYEPPKFEEKLEFTSDYVIEKTGMSRKRLHELLTFLHEVGIIE